MQELIRRLGLFLSPRSQPINGLSQLDNQPGWRAPATPEDVANCYALILGREPESDAVILEKVGMDRAELVCAFLLSDEFKDEVQPILAQKKQAHRFEGPVTDDFRRWASRLFLAGEQEWRTLTDIQDTGPLLAHCLRQPILSSLCEERLGPGEAEAIAEAAAKLAKPRLKGSTSREDLQNCYLLFLHRAPETESVVEARPVTPLAHSVCDFLASPEFATKVAYPAMDARAMQAELPPHVPIWAKSELHIDRAETLSLQELIAAVLAQPAIALALSNRTLTWSVDEVERGLQAATSGRIEKLKSVHKRLNQISCNLDVLASNHMKLARGHYMIRFSGHDPWVSLKPVGPATEGDLMVVRLRATIDGRPTVGQLYLDYGEGFTEANSLQLLPDREGFHRAVIATPRRIVAMRWDPAAMRGVASVSLMEAQPLSAKDFHAEEFGPAREAGDTTLLERLIVEAANGPTTPVAVALSRLLSPSADTPYARWILHNEPQGSTGKAVLKKRLEQLESRPLFSIIVPVYNPPPAALEEMIASVRGQIYPDWELCIANDASTLPYVREIVDRAANEDSRIKVVHRPVNGHICQASNSALDLSSGEWIAMLDHDDTLAPHALLYLAEYVVGHPAAQLIYSDEDKINENGSRFDPFFKPDYSPELLLAQNYINHLTAIRRTLVCGLGGWRTGFEGSQDHDLILRVVETLNADEIGHIPQILYHWRAHAGSTALENSEKNYALQAGEAAVRDHLSRTGRPATVEIMEDVHHFRVRYDAPEQEPLVSLIVPTRDKASVLKIAVDSILERSTYQNYEIIIIDNGSIEKNTFDYFDSLRQLSNISIIKYPKPFNYSSINNFGVKKSRGSIIGLINNDIEVITPDWIEEMSSWASRREIGCVGAKLYYPDRSIQHAGVILGLGGCAGHSHKYFPHDAPGYFYRLRLHQNLSAVTAACLFVRRDVFDEVGGLDERLAVAFNDVDFCLRVREAGYRNLFTPFAELYHHESISRGAEDTPAKMARAAKEVKFMKNRWGDMLLRDPFYSPNLTLDSEDFALNAPRAHN